MNRFLQQSFKRFPVNNPQLSDISQLVKVPPTHANSPARLRDARGGVVGCEEVVVLLCKDVYVVDSVSSLQLALF